MDDPFVHDYDAPELKIAAEFLTNWLPFLTRDLCPDCSQTLTSRIRSIDQGSSPTQTVEVPTQNHDFDRVSPSPPPDPGDGGEKSCEDVETSGKEATCEIPAAASPKMKMSWADMAQEDELEMEAEEGRRLEAEEKGKGRKAELSRERREHIRFMNVVRKKDFICLERVKGKIVNVLAGLELHTGVFSSVEQNRIVDLVYELQKKGRNGELGDHTYSEPEKWMRGKGRVTIQFGCCYNYAVDKERNPPGILKHVVADPLPSLFKLMVKRLVRWHVLPPTCIPNSCIVNIYEPGDCIPPHIDSHDFTRPFCTVSFLSECNIVFGSNLKIVDAGEFTGSAAIPLPVGSVLVLNGNGADVAKHCVPAVPCKRISITFRKMDESKHPYGFKPEPELHDIAPLPYESGVVKAVITSSGSRKHSVDVKVLERGKDNVGNHHPSSDREADLPTGKINEEAFRRSARMSQRQGNHRRHDHERYDLSEMEGSARKAVRQMPVSDSPGILPLPSARKDDTHNSRRQIIPNDLEAQNEHTPRRSTPDNLKPQSESVMKIICMDKKRIVVKSNPDDKEGSSWSGPIPDQGDSVSSLPHPLNTRRRKSK